MMDPVVPFLLAGGDPKWRPSESPTFTMTRPKPEKVETRGRPRKKVPLKLEDFQDEE